MNARAARHTALSKNVAFVAYLSALSSVVCALTDLSFQAAKVDKCLGEKLPFTTDCGGHVQCGHQTATLPEAVVSRTIGWWLSGVGLCAAMVDTPQQSMPDGPTAPQMRHRRPLTALGLWPYRQCYYPCCLCTMCDRQAGRSVMQTCRVAVPYLLQAAALNTPLRGPCLQTAPSYC